MFTKWINLRGSLMKKLLVLCGILALGTGVSFAYMDESETSDINALKSQGFSESMLRTVDLVNKNNSGLNGTYTRHYTPKYSKKGHFYNNVKLYFDPIQDDGRFGEHQINFTNTWMGDETEYSSQLKNTETVENL